MSHTALRAAVGTTANGTVKASPTGSFSRSFAAAEWFELCCAYIIGW
jgi:hypothetical protein